MEEFPPYVFLIILDSSNILLHGLGLSLLISLYNKCEKTVAQLYLLNLSISKLLKNLIYLLYDAMYITYLSRTKDIYYIIIYLQLITGTVIYWLYLFAVMFLLVDRLAIVLLNMRYSIIWNIRKARILITTSWFFCVSVSFLAFTLVYNYIGAKELTRYNITLKITYYIAIIFNGLFYIFAVLSYIIMFVKLKSKRRYTNKFSSNQSLFQVCRNSWFFIVSLLVASFLLLMVIPKLVLSISWINGDHLPEAVRVYIYISIALLDTVDGVIYIFMYAPVQRFLYATLSSLFSCYKIRIVRQQAIVKHKNEAIELEINSFVICNFQAFPWNAHYKYNYNCAPRCRCKCIQHA